MNDDFIWTKEYSGRAIALAILTVVGVNVAFAKFAMPIPIMLLGLLGVIFFFVALNRYTIGWQTLDPVILYRKLFWHSAGFRLLAVIYIYAYTFIYTPSTFPLTLGSADSWNYLKSGNALVGNIFNGQFLYLLPQYWRSSGDWGFPFYLGLVGSVLFNSVFVVILLNVFIGSLTVVLIAKIAGMLYSDSHARLAGILSMLMLPLMWYGAMYLKETVMIFLIILAIYETIRMVELTGFNLISTLIASLCTVSLFYFRTVIAVLLLLSIGGYLLMNTLSRQRSNLVPLMIAVAFAAVTTLVISRTAQVHSVMEQYGQIDNAGESTLSSKIKLAGSLNVKSAAVLPLVTVSAFVTPFPSLLYFEPRDIFTLAHFQNEEIRNLIFYFALIGVLIALRNDLRRSALLLFFGLGYILVLAVTAHSYEPRFQLPALPLLAIFMSVGMIDSSAKWLNRWNAYLFLIVCAQLAWQVFRLSIRGLV